MWAIEAPWENVTPSGSVVNQERRSLSRRANTASTRSVVSRSSARSTSAIRSLVTPWSTSATGSSPRARASSRIAVILSLSCMEAPTVGLEPPQNRKRGDGFSAVEFIQVVDPEIEERQRKAMMVELMSKK